jgi:hypothetical protein
VLAFDFPFFQLANVWLGEKDFLHFICANAVFFCNLGNEPFVPDHIVKAHAQRSLTVILASAPQNRKVYAV